MRASLNTQPMPSGSLPALGCGGNSRLGTRTNGDPFNVIKACHEAGVTVFDTAESYRTETILADAIKRLGIQRDSITIATKTFPFRAGPYDMPWHEIPLKSADQIRDSVYASLRRLDTEYIDTYFLHAPMLKTYEHSMPEIVPELVRLKEAGIVRSIGVTEMFAADTNHEMLTRAIQDDWIDTIMVGFNILNQSARDAIYAEAKAASRAKPITTMNMFSVRRAMTNQDHLLTTIQSMIQSDDLDDTLINPENPFDFLDTFDGHTSEMHAPGGVTETAYRFVAHEPNVDITLFGTGNPAHARSNVEAIRMPPLAAEVREALIARFGACTTASGN